MKDFLRRTPFSILTALGLLSLASVFVHLEQHIAEWVHVWRAVTYPITETLFGWFFEWIGVKLPNWLKDYFFLCLLIASARTRAIVSGVASLNPADRNIKLLIPSIAGVFTAAFLFAPHEVLGVIRSLPFKRGAREVKSIKRIEWIFDNMDYYLYIIQKKNDEAAIKYYETMKKTYHAVTNMDEKQKVRFYIVIRQVFKESFIYAFIIIAASYSLILLDISEPVKPERVISFSEPVEI